jgi:hypothetical protein
VAWDDESKVGITKHGVSDEYRNLINRLSLKSSQHLSPPYNSLDEFYRDYPRQLWRRFWKRLGLPASTDVRIIGEYVKVLREDVEEQLGETVWRAAVSFPRLLALYKEDISDALEWAGIEYQDVISFEPLTDASANYAANGFGLCHEYKDSDRCQEEKHKFPLQNTIHIQFTNNALVVELVTMFYAESYILWPNMAIQDFDLGFNNQNISVDYWDLVRERMIGLFKRNEWTWNPDPPTQVFITGDDSALDETFRKVVREACSWKDNDPEYFDDDVYFMTAKGTAELSKRQYYRSPLPQTVMELDLK